MANIDNVQLPDGSSYNIVDNTSGFATQNYVDSAVSSVTKTTIGLGNVDNTSDLNKPISTATQTALDTLDEDKAEKTDIATVESGTTASRAYSVGELVYVSGTLYRVKTAIASGATFTVGTNVEVTNVSNSIKSTTERTSYTITSAAGGTVGGYVRKKSGVVFISLYLTQQANETIEGWGSKTIATISNWDNGAMSWQLLNTPLINAITGDFSGMLQIGANGEINVVAVYQSVTLLGGTYITANCTLAL